MSLAGVVARLSAPRVDAAKKIPSHALGGALLVVSLLVVSLLERVQAAELAVLARPPARAAARELTQLETSSTRPVRVRWDLYTGRVRSLAGRWPLGFAPDGAVRGSPEETSALSAASVRFLAAWSDAFGPLEEGLEVHLTSRRDGRGSVHLRHALRLRGYPLDRGELVFHLDVTRGMAETAIVAVTSDRPALGPGGAAAVDTSPARRLHEQDAVAIAEAHVGGTIRAASRAGEVISTRAVPPRLAWTIVVDTLDPPGRWVVQVDAQSGEVLSAGNRLWTLGEPGDGSGRVFTVNPIVDLRRDDLVDMDDAADAVPEEAYTEVTLPELDGSGFLVGPYVTTFGTPDAVRRVRLSFPFTRDHDGFEEVMLYHHIDSTQRFIQSLGFTDVYNAPIPAYANSQPPGIPYEDIQAFYMPSVANPGTGELAFGSGGIDAAEDAEVVVHEYGHATQDSQVPGFGGTFESLEAWALGEGYSDFLAGAYLAAFSGGWGDECLGEWFNAGVPEDWRTDPSCVRRLDSEKHYPGDLVGEPHDDGEMWSASLWQVFEELGRVPALELGIQSNYFLPVAATFRDAADAVLRADEQLHGGAHRRFLERVFTDRGILGPPPSETWFHTSQLAPAVRIPALGTHVFKTRLERAGRVEEGVEVPVEVLIELAFADFPAFEIVLRSPAGTEVVLFDPFVSLISSGTSIFGRTAVSAQPLAILAGEPVAGVWTLFITNFHFEEAVTVSRWGLRFQGFLRGDVDRSGEIDVTDAVRLLVYLFGRESLPCRKAGDFDDDGALNISDAIGLLLFSFVGGSPPAEPWPAPGEDLTPDDLDCAF